MRSHRISTKTLLVTGGAGFIGSHVVDALVAEGARVVVLDDLSTGSAGRLAPEAALEVLDIADCSSLDRTADAARPAAIIHLAAQSSVTRSVADPRRDCRANVVGTLNVLEAARRHRAPVVFTSTGGALYGNRAAIPTPEDSPPAPVSPYGASKWAAEAYVQTWRHASGIPHTVCRLANVYGPRQSPHGEAGVVAIFSYNLWRHDSPTLFGFGRPTRDYVHVYDVARALVAAIGNPGVFNVATGRMTSVMDIFSLLQTAAGTSVEPILASLRPGELTRSCMDPTRASRSLGWQAQIDLKDGMPLTYHALVQEFEAGVTSSAG